jgi:hypothetical protein
MTDETEATIVAEEDPGADPSREAYLQEVAAHYCLQSQWAMDPDIDLFAKHPYEGTMCMWYVRNNHPEMKVIFGDRWIDLWVTADWLVLSDGPTDHMFIEGFKQAETTMLELQTES